MAQKNNRNLGAIDGLVGLGYEFSLVLKGLAMQTQRTQKSRRFLVGIAILAPLWCFCTVVDAGEKHTLTWESLDKYRDKILATEQERGWKDIAWRHDFASAIAEAHHLDRPVLLWAMNGDPLGCT